MNDSKIEFSSDKKRKNIREIYLQSVHNNQSIIFLINGYLLRI
jgi:hypothetical protein